jgi:hypothetical protein
VEKMKRIISLMVIGMFVIVGLGAVAMGEPDDPVVPNQAPSAPILMEDKSSLEKETYTCVFYSTDPDGDKVFYDIKWEKVLESYGEPDDPVVPWLGPFESGEEVTDCHTCHESGDYTMTIRAKDEFDNIGPSTTITVSYTKEKVFQLPVFARLLAKFPGFVYILTKIFKI